MHIQERRIAERFQLELLGCAIINGNNVGLKTQDVSLGGALAEFFAPPSLKEGTKLCIRLNIRFMGSAVVCRVNARDYNSLCGLKFERFDYYSDLLLSAYFIKNKHHLSERATIQ